MTLFGSFDRPIGAAADAKELEYIASLHQTRPKGRIEGTISATDIVAFVRSRSGLAISHDKARDVVRGLGGGDVCDAALRRLYGEQKLSDDNNDKSSRELDDELIKQELGGSVDQKMSVKLKEHLARRKKELMETGGGNGMDKSMDDTLLPSVRTDDELQPNEGSAAPNRQQKSSITSSKSTEEKCKEEYLDLVQLLSILYIPVFARASYDHERATTGNNSGEILTETSVYSSQQGGTVNPVVSAIDTAINTAAEAVNVVKDKTVNVAGEAMNVVTTAVGMNTEEVQTAFEMEQRKKFEDMRIKPEGLIGHVLSLLLKSVNAEEDSVLDKELVKQLLIAHSEFERAEDDELLEEMVNMARGSAHTKMNLDAFFRALTSDIKAYDPVCESRVTTTIYDVFGLESLDQIRRETKDGSAGNEQDEENATVPPLSSLLSNSTLNIKVPSELVWKPMSASIDLVLDTHRSVSFTVSLWVFYIFLVVTYTIPLTAQGLVDSVICEVPFGCNLGSKIVKWLGYAIFFVIAGFIVVYPIQLGNDPTLSSTRKQILGIALILMYTVVPFIAVALYQHYQISVNEYSALDSLAMESGMLICVISGGILLVISLLLLISNRIGSKRIRNSARASKWLTSHNIRAESDIKRATNHKIKRMLLNASSLHPKSSMPDNRANGENVVIRRSAKDEAVLNFILKGDKIAPCGGLLWTWKQIWNRTLYEEEGIWIHTRLLIGQVGQVMVIAFLSVLLFFGTKYIAAAADKAREQLESTGEIVDLPRWVYDFVPTGQQVYQTFTPGTVTALIVAISIFILYIPSTTATILKFRTGMLPSLRDPSFQRFKVGVDSVFFNASNMIWALFGAALLFAVLVTGLLFLILWPFTRDLIVLAAAWILGLFITILLKTITLKLMRRNCFSAFYRMKPSGANRSTLAFECWQIGLGGGVLISRLIQFILASFFYIGRIDVPFLSDHISFLGYRFDLVPTHFQKDILVHEAHRHPYLERIQAMYLMRLRHGERFSCRAGACWRQLFVLALMPWLSKYRIFQHKREADAVEDYEFMMRMKRVNNDASLSKTSQ